MTAADLVAVVVIGIPALIIGSLAVAEILAIRRRERDDHWPSGGSSA